MSEQARENLKNDFDKSIVVDLLCSRIDELEAENAELRKRVGGLERVLRVGREALQAVVRGEFGLQDAVRACRVIDTTLSPRAKPEEENGK